MTALGLHQKYLDSYVSWSISEDVFKCLSKVPEHELRTAEKAHGNFDARQFHCIFRDEPFWTNINEVRGDRYFKVPPKYWTESSYRLELIPLVVVAVILGGALLAALIWVIRWTFGLSSKSTLAPNMNAWITAVVTGTLSAVIAGMILSKIL